MSGGQTSNRQAETCELAVSDLEALLKSVPVVCVFIDWNEKHTKDLLGIFYPGSERACPKIWLNPCNHGRALYRVVLHELGHLLGLNHTKAGIMAPKRKLGPDFDQRPPTLAQRKAWTLEIVQQVIDRRAKTTWKKAA